jgi:glucose/arabinose dehydrogenase
MREKKQRMLCLRRTLARTACGWLATMTSANAIHAASLPNGFEEVVISGVITRATTMTFAPDGKLFVLEQDGTMEVYRGFGAQPWTQVAPMRNFFTGSPLTVSSTGERGLLGLAFDPNYAGNRHLYIYYTATTPTIHNRISRFTANAAGTRVIAGSEAVIMDLETLTAGNHNGGAMHFGPDGKLYVAVGDNANSNNAQSISNRLGKILRLNPDPLNPIPADNPVSIAGIAGMTAGVNRAIWAAGLRNPYTFVFKPGTNPGVMYINDVGENTWEEVNVGAPGGGANYGWNDTEGPFNQGSFPEYTHPILYYHHTNGSLSHPTLAGFTGRAITGGAFYLPQRVTFPSGYVGDYFFADYVSDWIKRYDPNSKVVRNFASNAGSPVDLRVGDDGALYYLARDAEGFGMGRVFRVRFDRPCPADVDPAGGNTFVNADDLMFVLLALGDSASSPADVNGDDAVDADDVLAVIDAWGMCP